jgi:hypothetical protein
MKGARGGGGCWGGDVVQLFAIWGFEWMSLIDFDFKACLICLKCLGRLQ